MQSIKKTRSPVEFDPTNKQTGILRLVLALKNSLRALKWLSKNEAAFKQEVLFLLVSIVVVAYWKIPIVERGLLISSVLFVIFAEVFNTAIEATIDRIGREIHPLSGLAKDLGSAGVSLAMLIAAVLWLSILLSHF
ncbi:Diacylglycerol kinase [Paraglaciecola mesophila]|uniref:Diacylglycerol kinase n=1 Tax=Paraglaciecola mesophila TaxID=197222 RepID=A0A857JL29_9ALTE|nr:diacylglycerol kinase [Paraglaciecola mesophila]QHJ11334.1 Diacylglycerol kinase [Paraglaciecola mesophila]